MSVSAREKLRKLIGLPEGKFLSDFEMEIEYQSPTGQSPGVGVSRTLID